MMNARVLALIGGVVTLVGGLAGLFGPEQALPWIGFRAVEPIAWSLGEVRATYGGLFVVIGVYGLLAALDPVAHRGRLLMIGLMWWGVAGGRALGASLDGNPGVLVWGYLVGETLLGGLFVAASATAQTSLAASTGVAPTPAV